MTTPPYRDARRVFWIVDKVAHDHASPRENSRKCIPAEWLDGDGIEAFGMYGTFSHFRADRYDELIAEYRHLAEQAHAHRRALEVPAGAPAAVRAVPARLAGGGGLPEHEVGGVFLVGSDLDPAPDALGALAEHWPRRTRRPLAGCGQRIDSLLGPKVKVSVWGDGR